MPVATRGFQPAGRAPAPPPLDLVQDFVNTEIAEWAQDDIATPELLAAWLRDRGLIGERDDADPESFVTARALRGVLRRLALRNTLRREVDDDLREDVANAVAGLRFRADLASDGELVLVPDDSGARQALASIVARVLDAQAAGTWARLKSCRKESCGWLFYDASRNASSTWCSMSICGNRTKTAEYRRRRRSAS